MESNPEVTINKTIFVGKYLKTWKDKDFCSFRGIRYAAAPVGDKRFKDPVPFYFPAGKYDATKDGNDCPSIYATNPSDDCLFLNIYTRSITQTDLKPVIAFIHPGGLYIGSALSNFIGPEYLMEKEIVLVTFNYRLGALGFLNLGTKEYPGNAGFKDQVFALRWIKKNITHFSGNPKNITLMGYSAGALSVCLHIVSPMSINLFNRAIIMSGSVPPQTKIPIGHQRNLALRQVKVLGCENIYDENETNKIVEFLKGKTSMEISMTLRKMFFYSKDNPIYLWLPVIEIDYGQERFLIDDPYVALKNGNFKKIPILIGFTDKEFGQSAYDILANNVLLEEFNRKFGQLAPICFMYELHHNKENITNKIHHKLSKHSISNNLPSTTSTNTTIITTIPDSKMTILPTATIGIDIKNILQLNDLFSDSIIRLGASEFAFRMSKYVDEIYRYRFSYVGRYTNFNGSYKWNGAEHMDDLWYLFKMNPSFSPTDPEAGLIDMMVEFFSSFAFGISFIIGNNWKLGSKKFVQISGKELEIKDDDVEWFDRNFYQNLFEIN